MKKIILVIIVIIILTATISTLTSCSQAEKVNSNLTLQADNFNIEREVTAINGITGEILFQMRGRLSITADREDNQLEIIVEHSNGVYRKHFIGLSDNTAYVVEDLGEAKVDKYGYELNFNPKFLKAFKPVIVD
jgi:hypothetical protein